MDDAFVLPVSHEMRTRNVHGLLELHVHMGMFDFGINVAIGPVENLTRYVRYKLEDEDFGKNDDAVRLTDGRGWYIARRGFCQIVWIPRFPRSPREYGTLAHESIHAVSRMMEWASIPSNYDTEEVLTHGVSHIVTSVLAARRR